MKQLANTGFNDHEGDQSHRTPRHVIEQDEDVYNSVTSRPLTRSWHWDSILILSKLLSIKAHFRPFPLIGKNVIELGWAPRLIAVRLKANRVVLTDVTLNLPG